MSTLIADCGSTKVEWAIIHTDRSDNAPNDTSVFRTTGFNAAITPADEIARLLSEELAPAIAGANITRLHFYGAGCIGGDTDRRLLSLMRAILPDAEIEIQGDLLGAARALFGHNPGIACILGTGSNCGMYDGNAITLNTPPMGYILGDEGSGAVLGRNLVNLVFKHHGLLPDEIVTDFDTTYGLSKADIIQRVYRQPGANRFLASFCPFISKHITHPAMRRLVAGSFRDFLIANLPVSASPEGQTTVDCADMPIGFVGSIAYHFSDMLAEACAAFGLDAPVILPAPLKALAAYHLSR